MKKVLIVAAATGLMSLAACGGTPAANNTAENTIEALENGAELLENEAAGATNEAGAILENAADGLENAAANVAE
jgi:hypothetical protein